MDKWIKTLSPPKPVVVVDVREATGVGDKINFTPALRRFKAKVGSEVDIALMVDDFGASEVFAHNPHISYLFPARLVGRYSPLTIDRYIKLEWSFYEHHQNGHVCGSYMKHLCGEWGDSCDYTMEMFVSVQEYREVLSLVEELPRDKPWAAVSPAYTMYARILPAHLWQDLVDLLSRRFHVLSFGNRCDFSLDNVIDLRGRLRINQIPLMLNWVEEVYTVNTGFLHISGCNPKVRIHYLNVGEFPASLVIPYRNGRVGWNVEVYDHDCELKEKCFQGLITEREYGAQLRDNVLKYAGRYPGSLIKKYTAWHYCLEPVKKYRCSSLVFERVKRVLNKMK